MPARWMQQKVLKLKKAKKAYPKRYAAEYIQGKGKTRHNSIRDKLRESGRPDIGSSFAFDNKFLESIQQQARFKGVPSARKEVLDLIEKMSEKNGYSLPFFFQIIDNCVQRCQIWYNSEHTRHYILHIDKKRQVARRSIEYDSKSYALKKWHMDRVTWVEEVSLRRPAS